MSKPKKKVVKVEKLTDQMNDYIPIPRWIYQSGSIWIDGVGYSFEMKPMEIPKRGKV